MKWNDQWIVILLINSINNVSVGIFSSTLWYENQQTNVPLLCGVLCTLLGNKHQIKYNNNLHNVT